MYGIKCRPQMSKENVIWIRQNVHYGRVASGVNPICGFVQIHPVDLALGHIRDETTRNSEVSSAGAAEVVKPRRVLRVDLLSTETSALGGPAVRMGCGSWEVRHLSFNGPTALLIHRIHGLLLPPITSKNAMAKQAR